MPTSSPPASRAPIAPITGCCVSTCPGRRVRDNGFTLLFEQAALSLMREMPVAAAPRIIGVTDQRLWRVLFFYIDEAIARLDLSGVRAIALDETAAKRGHTYANGVPSISTPPKSPCCSSPPARARKAWRRSVLSYQNTAASPSP